MSETNSLVPQQLTTDESRPADTATTKASQASGHALFERVGVGGMGEVYRCGDDSLQRDLAIKILKAELRGNADAEERFLREARLTGSLQHPGIVPIHQFGQLADGRPCYTMKLVRGRTFADLLRDEPEGPERLPRLLAVLEKICQAVAFAHSKGVIHRDLKPSNVMVGEFGEVQVMDWGLAKELSRSEPAPPPEATVTVETVAWTEEGEGLSRAGSALGTPAYMPPEQAAGDWDIVDERADVFALGAILCEMLTGKPPYHEGNREDLLRRARRGDLAEALGRLDKCGADVVLVGLCRECLAVDRLQRPRHAGVVAERLASYQAEVRERLRQAELERARAEVKSLEERKRRRLIVALALSALVLLAGGAAAWWQWHQRRATANGAVAGALVEGRLLRDQARLDVLSAVAYEKALAAAHNAVEIASAGGASEEISRQAKELYGEVKQEAEAAAKDRRLLAALLEVHNPREGPKYSRDDKGMLMALAEPTADEQFASAFRDWGLDVEATPTAEAAARLKARPAAVVTEVIAALDEWTNYLRVNKKREAKKKVSNLAAALDEDSSSLRSQLRDILARGRLPIERVLGMLSVALRPVPVPVEVPLGKNHRRLRQLAEKIEPASEPVLGLLTLTRALRTAGEESLAERLLRAALTARPQEVVLYHTLGQMLTEQKPPRWAEAVEFYRAARGLRPDLGVDLADALLNSSRADEGLALLAHMVHENHNNPYLRFKRAYALYGKGQTDEAIAQYQHAIALDTKYVAAHYNLGIALYNKGQLDGAMAQYSHIVAANPNHVMAHNNLGAALDANGQSDAAMAEYRQAISLDPKLAAAHNNLGKALHDDGQLDEAIAEYRKAIALNSRLAPAHNNLGNGLYDEGEWDAAVVEYRQAIALDPKYAQAHNNLGSALRAKGQLDEAIAEIRQAIALNPEYARAHNNLGNALVDEGKHTEAEAVFRKAIALTPDYAMAYNNLGVSLGLQGKHAEAEAAFRQAIALKSDDAEKYNNFGLSLSNQGKPMEAESAYRKAVALKPDYAEAHCNLGSVLRRQGRFTESLAVYRRGHELGSKQANWRYPSLQWVHEAEHLVELEKKLPAALTDEAAPANPGDAVALAQMCQQYKKRHVAASRLYAAAFAAEPHLAQQHRYNAACSAVLAAAGQDKDARQLPDKVTAMFRSWALSWLRDDLTVYAKLAEQNKPDANKTIQQTLAHWRRDPDLASVRHPQALERLPDNERTAWQALWRDVDELGKRAAKQDKAGEKREKREDAEAPNKDSHK